jgi:hypothetical protein
MRWSIKNGEAVSGPFDERELPTLIRAGLLTTDSLVSPEGAAQWQPIGNSPFGKDLAQRNSPPEMRHRKKQARAVSGPLTLGILFFPLIFAWATLRSGHSAKARVFSFAWMTAGLVAAAIASGAFSPKLKYQCSARLDGSVTCDFTNYGRLPGSVCVSVDVRQKGLPNQLGSLVANVDVCSGSIESNGMRRTEARFGQSLDKCIVTDVVWTDLCDLLVAPMP